MMSMPPHAYLNGRRAEERSQDRMRDGEHARLMRMAEPVKFGPRDWLLTRISRLLISTGEKLQAQCGAVELGLKDSALRTSR